MSVMNNWMSLVKCRVFWISSVVNEYLRTSVKLVTVGVLVHITQTDLFLNVVIAVHKIFIIVLHFNW